MRILIQLSFLLFTSIIKIEGFNSISGVTFSPYTKSGGRTSNGYSYEDIKSQLNTVTSKFKYISTYSMGVNSSNLNKNWYEAEGNCLIARAAADLNQRANSQIKVSIGIYQNENRGIENKEIENAFKAASEANQKFAGTVWGIVFTNEYVQDINETAKATRVLQMIRDNRNKGLRVGIRTHHCEFIMADGKPMQQIVAQIARESHFIMCNVYPNASDCNASGMQLEGVRRSIASIGMHLLQLRSRFLSFNPMLEVMVGETGWASEGETFNNCPNNIDNMKNYWWGMADWGQQNNMRIHFFEGVDEPWKEGKDGEKHFGWWFRNENSEPPNLVEKVSIM